jgi:hypothetical protein
MRRISVVVILVLVALPSFAQTVQRPVPNPDRQPPAFQRNGCCPRVYDAKGKLVGEMIRWDDRFPSIPLTANVRYPVGGDGDVALHVTPEAISGLQGLGAVWRSSRPSTAAATRCSRSSAGLR